MQPEQYLSKIKAEFPQIGWRSYTFLTHGWDHVVVILDEKIIFRFPKEGSYKQALLNEIQLLAYLKKKMQQNQLTMDIPDYTYLSANKTFAGYHLVQGKELDSEIFGKLSTYEKDTIARQLAAFLTVLHATPTSAIRKYKIEPENQTELYQQLVVDKKQYVFPQLSSLDIALIEDYFIALKVACDHKYQPVLVHNDLTSEHILWDSNAKQINIIDFSDRAYSDPAIDFAGLLEYGHLFASTVLEYYTGKKDAQLLYRAQLYHKRIALFLMIDALKGFDCTFEQGYAQFQHRFRK